MMFKPLQSRRHFLHAGLFLAGMSAVAVGKTLSDYRSQAVEDLQKRSFEVSGQGSLKKRAAAIGLIYGAATMRPYLADLDFSSSFIRECGILAPENELKWDALRPSPSQFDFRNADWLLGFARRNSMLFRGHTLVWHMQLPQWFKEVVNHQNAEKFLQEHIATVTKRYAGQMHSIDVVNEAIEPADGRRDQLRKTPWLEFLGPDYIEFAFRTAAAYDSKAILVYNELGLEYDTADGDARRNAVLKLLERLKSKGTPIHALGIQSHLVGHSIPFNSDKLRKFLASVASLGLKILITELDVVDQKLALDFAIRDRIVAARYQDYLKVVLRERAVIAVLTWGLSDRYTWHSSYNPRKDLAPVRPLPLSNSLKRKLAWNAMAIAFDQAPKR
ncbi:endo-1,4-beta-xylanase [Calothrix sp. NIES-4071]|nr:endo-1,4-beta-xylanase [Calothrix sp. NIES-4071]BAZ54536.1 endo-1,4-beta-xylanase [Calothrix sp. NIES-4105]